MKIELEEIKRYLTAFRDSELPSLNIKALADILEINTETSDLKPMFHYLMLLRDQELISGVNLKPEQQETLGFTFHGNGTIIWGNYSVMLRLTHQGHKVLESLSQSKIFEFSKKQLESVGVETLKMLPSLGIEFIKSQLGL